MAAQDGTRTRKACSLALQIPGGRQPPVFTNFTTWARTTRPSRGTGFLLPIIVYISPLSCKAKFLQFCGKTHIRERHQSVRGRHSGVTATATGDEGRYCKAGNQYGKTGIPAYQMDGRLFVRFCRHHHHRRRHTFPNPVVPWSCPVTRPWLGTDLKSVPVLQDCFCGQKMRFKP